MSIWKKIWAWIKERGFRLRTYKPALYLFCSMLAVVFGVVLGVSPLMAVVAVMTLGVLKQLVWDVFLKGQGFDWHDLLYMLIGCGFGFLFTAGYYRWVA